MGEECKMKFYKKCSSSSRRPSRIFAPRWPMTEKDLNQMKKYFTSVRVILHTQMEICRRRQKKAHVMEVQLYGGSIADKVDFARDHFEKEIPVELS